MRAKLLWACLPAVLMAAAYGSQALAWSCVASSSDGAQGWSQNYSSERGAERRALSECNNVTTSGDCEVQSCVPDNGKS